MITAPGGAFQMGHRVELPCVYVPAPGETWVIMRWKHAAKVYVSIVIGQTSYEWQHDAPHNFRVGGADTYIC